MGAIGTHGFTLLTPGVTPPNDRTSLSTYVLQERVHTQKNGWLTDKFSQQTGVDKILLSPYMLRTISYAVIKTANIINRADACQLAKKDSCYL